MRKEVIAQASTVEEAQAAALAQLGLSADRAAEVTFETLQEPQKKTFGLFGGSPAEVKAVWEENLSPAEAAAAYLRDVLAALGVGDTVPEILNIPLSDPVVRYRGRAGEVEETSVIPEERLTIYRFGDKTGIYDYSKEQYFSGIRMPLIHVKGTRGEMVNTTVRYLQDGVAHEFELKRAAFGEYENLDGMGIAAVTGHGRIWYKPPFEGARLSDEEMAIATALLKMSHYVKTGEDFYSLGSAAWDVALSCVQ